MLAADLHRRSTKAVLREYAGDGSAFIQQKHRQIFTLRLAHTGFGHANAHAGDGVQVSGNGSREIHWHGFSF